ncbi:uncharacterized protein LOC132308778 [Cornus florida]|uniref:uncharacterized protein LOC132308778 n=1 Tax=Cornus florida TaxID=4283 RepID=UPI00289E392F|nr:uncharacterized protein LOC132308778 [Cornus florida]
MATSRLLTLFIFLALIFTKIGADSSITGEEVGSDGSDSSSSLKIELDQLKSKIHSLESWVDEKAQELKSKDETIAEKEKIIQEKSISIASLQKEISSFQEKGKLDVDSRVEKAYARAAELEKQVDILKKEIETKDKEKDALEVKRNESKEKGHKLNLKLENLQKIIDEQKAKIQKTERALAVAEEEMLKAKIEATSKTKDLVEVHGAWLPPWLAVHSGRCQSFVETHWKEYGKPTVDALMQKALEKKAQAGKWAAPHMETIKTQLIPAVKEQWLVMTTYVEPHVKSLTTKTVEVYEASRSTITPHIIKTQEVFDPYFQEVKKFSQPYIDQVATVAKPHVDKAHDALKPYKTKVVHACRKFLESASMYHHQVQGTVQETLKKHEMTRPLATKELVWFAASALLALPIMILFRICSSIFCKKAKKPIRNGNSNHARRKAKRGHSER